MAAAWTRSPKENSPPPIPALLVHSGVPAVPEVCGDKEAGAQTVPGEVAEPAGWARSQYFLAVAWVKKENEWGPENSIPIPRHRWMTPSLDQLATNPGTG